MIAQIWIQPGQVKFLTKGFLPKSCLPMPATTVGPKCMTMKIIHLFFLKKSAFLSQLATWRGWPWPASGAGQGAARFIEPSSGRRICPQSQPNQISDYLMAAVHADLRLAHMSEHAVDSALAEMSPRAAKHFGWPLLLLMHFKPVNEHAWCGPSK